MKEEFEKIIYNWVKNNFGESEADDPSWSIEALADELGKQFHNLYEKQEKEYIAEDVEYVANEMMGKKLSDRQIGAVADKYYYSESYGACDTDAIEWFIDQYAGEK